MTTEQQEALREQIKSLVWGEGKVVDINTDKIMQLFAQQDALSRMDEIADALSSPKINPYDGSTSEGEAFKEGVAAASQPLELRLSELRQLVEGKKDYVPPVSGDQLV